MQKIIQRSQYLNQLKRLKDKQIIKVVTGIRRCGKPTLFDMFSEYLKETGVSEHQIIRINLEDPDYFEMNDYLSLYRLIKEQLVENKQNYILIDEVQNAVDFQKAIDGLFIKDNCDVYINGSNAYLLSGELATFLSGRYTEIKMLPLSFKEYVSYFDVPMDVMRMYMQ